jgi:hypothetical protein
MHSNKNRQCFFGDLLIGAKSASASDCSTPCAGNSTELCGGGNRIDVYQDLSWFIPSIPQLITATEELNATLFQLQQEINAYEQDISEALSQGKASSSKRQTGGVFDPLQITLPQQMKIQNDEEEIKALVARIGSFKYFQFLAEVANCIPRRRNL